MKVVALEIQDKKVKYFNKITFFSDVSMVNAFSKGIKIFHTVLSVDSNHITKSLLDTKIPTSYFDLRTVNR